MLQNKTIQAMADRYTAYQKCFQHGESENHWEKAYEKEIECMDDIPRLIDEVTRFQSLMSGLQRVRVHSCTVASSECWYKNRLNEEFFLVPLTEEHSDRYHVLAYVDDQTKICPIKKEDVSLIDTIIMHDKVHTHLTHKK